MFDYLEVDLKEVHCQLLGHRIARKVLGQVNKSVQYRLLLKFSDQSFGKKTALLARLQDLLEANQDKLNHLIVLRCFLLPLEAVCKVRHQSRDDLWLRKGLLVAKLLLEDLLSVAV